VCGQRRVGLLGRVGVGAAVEHAGELGIVLEDGGELVEGVGVLRPLARVERLDAPGLRHAPRRLLRRLGAGAVEADLALEQQLLQPRLRLELLRARVGRRGRRGLGGRLDLLRAEAGQLGQRALARLLRGQVRRLLRRQLRVLSRPRRVHLPLQHGQGGGRRHAVRRVDALRRLLVDQLRLQVGGIRLQLGHLRREPRLLLLLLRPHLGELRLQLRDLRGGGGCELRLLRLLLLRQTLQRRERRRLLRQLGLDLVQLVVRRGVAQLLLVEVGLRPGQFRLKLCDHCAGCLAAGRDGGLGGLLLRELLGGQFRALPLGLEFLLRLRQLLPEACSVLEGLLDRRLGRRLGCAPGLLRLAQLVGAVVQGLLKLRKFGARATSGAV